LQSGEKKLSWGKQLEEIAFEPETRIKRWKGGFSKKTGFQEKSVGAVCFNGRGRVGTLTLEGKHKTKGGDEKICGGVMEPEEKILAWRGLLPTKGGKSY